MDGGAWWAIVHGIVRVSHDLATKPPQPNSLFPNQPGIEPNAFYSVLATGPPKKSPGAWVLFLGDGKSEKSSAGIWADLIFTSIFFGNSYIEILLLGRKAVTNLDSILKNRDTPLLTKIHIVKAMAFQ